MTVCMSVILVTRRTYKPALTDVLCISCINVIHCSKVTKLVLGPLSIDALIWTLCERRYIHAKLRCNKCGVYSDRPTLPLVEEEAAYPNI
jgi:hypothetical protein